MKSEKYFEMIHEMVEKDYAVANAARAKGLDPVNKVEIPIATSLAEKAVGLVSSMYPQVNDKRIVNHILELEKKYSSLDPCVACSIAADIAKEKFCKFKDHHEAIEAGVRIAIAYMTLGVVSSPIEGFVQIKIEKTRDGKDYFAPYYSGPIRSAGGTEAAFSLVVVDHLREIFGYAPYDPTEDEIKRGVHESYEYHERITNLQYLPTEKEIEFLMRYLPIQVTGDPSEDREVYNYKDLPRVPTNFIRSGFALTLNEGLAQKAPKILKRVKILRENGFKMSDWNFLEEFVALQDKIKKEKKTGAATGGAVYIKDLVAGRPVYSHPSRSGAFRLRYGRCRNTGYSCLAINPASMRICNDSIAVGTQLKIEKPTKGAVMASCTNVDGPVVKFKDGSVKKIIDQDEAKRRYKEVEEIIYLGDMLVPYGDFKNRNHKLEPQGYIEQFWQQEVRKAGEETELHVPFDKAVEISSRLRVPLHPDYIFYWSQIVPGQLFSLIEWLKHGEVADGKLVLPWSRESKEKFAEGKRGLELIACDHSVTTENVVIEPGNARALLFNLGIEQVRAETLGEDILRVLDKLNLSPEEPPLALINKLCSAIVRDKAGTFIGSRMGRPEKAKLRKLTGSPHVLFPVGEEGGRLRSVQAAIDVGVVRSDFQDFYCDGCKKSTIYPTCEVCGGACKIISEEGHSERAIDIRHYFDHAKKLAGVSADEVPIVRGVRGTSNREHAIEFLAKGLLRAKYNLHVNKDGTIRYDMSEMPLTHFKPKEVGTSIEKLKSLGYENDVYGKPLERDDQILELFPHDVVLPACTESPDERADDVFFKVAQFVDDELERIYGLPKYFNAKKREDIVGALLGCIAPHNCASVVGRIVGFSKTQGMLASPYMHAAMRRDCDGDEAAVMLFMDMLLNFSQKFLPAHRGGTQDAPLVVNARIRAGEVDDMIFDVDVTREISLELFEAAAEKKSPYDIKMEQVKNRLGTGNEFHDLWFSYDTEDINLGPLCSSYKILPTMGEKVASQMELGTKIRAVDTSDVSRLVIERHFIRDIRGNLRKFSMQGFRCVDCNEKFRRPPLIGKCNKCGGKILFTITEGSIMKYVQPALDLARKYGSSAYLLESLELAEMYIQSIFGKEKERQEALKKWF